MQIGTYLKRILDKKGITQQELVDRINAKGLTQKGELTKHRMSDLINNKITFTAYTARQVEIVLDLPKYSLVELVGFPKTEKEKKGLEELG